MDLKLSVLKPNTPLSFHWSIMVKVTNSRSFSHLWSYRKSDTSEVGEAKSDYIVMICFGSPNLMLLYLLFNPSEELTKSDTVLELLRNENQQINLARYWICTSVDSFGLLCPVKPLLLKVQELSIRTRAC